MLFEEIGTVENNAAVEDYVCQFLVSIKDDPDIVNEKIEYYTQIANIIYYCDLVEDACLAPIWRDNSIVGICFTHFVGDDDDDDEDYYENYDQKELFFSDQTLGWIEEYISSLKEKYACLEGLVQKYHDRIYNYGVYCKDNEEEERIAAEEEFAAEGINIQYVMQMSNGSLDCYKLIGAMIHVTN